MIEVLIPMDYEDYYYESRSRYYDACSEVNNYENRANELRSQGQRKIIYINQLKSDLKRHQKLLKEHPETKQKITIKPFDNDSNLVDYNVRADEITNDFFYEVKASDTAPYTQNQKNWWHDKRKRKRRLFRRHYTWTFKGIYDKEWYNSLHSR